MGSCFSGCSSLTSIPELNVENVTNMGYCFDGCSSLTSIPELNTEKATTMGSCFNKCTKLKRISGISFKSVPSISSYSSFFFGYTANTTCSYILIKDIGTNSNCTTLDFTYARAWGVADTDNPDARQSLIDSLLTYSFDRASAGYSNCTIKLYSTVKALLTQEEIDAIQAKGYIIS
jgi:surface protein